jgi:lipopolysaccharide/colanic/teichoic acid biosynthesis glycosyltransferase
VSRAITSLASDGQLVLLRQQRYGFNRNNIEISNFHTMYADRCDKGIWRACSPTLVRCRRAG